MAMSTGNAHGFSSEINVTPMIDVLLVLLIIFMVIVPALPKGESVLAPQPQRSAEPGPDAVVLEMTGDSGGKVSYAINQHTVAPAELASRLAAIYANRAQRVLFLKGDDHLSFTQVAEVIDISHAAGVDHVGLMTPQILAGR